MSDSALMPWTSPLSLETAFPAGDRGPVLRLEFALFAANRAGLISRFGFAPGAGPASCCGDIGASIPSKGDRLGRRGAPRPASRASPGDLFILHYRGSRRPWTMFPRPAPQSLARDRSNLHDRPGPIG